jgi:hypothetical protein
MDVSGIAFLSSFVDPTWTTWSTVWSAIGAIGTLAAFGAILYAVRQIKFEAWTHIQDKWNNKEQYRLRKALFERRETKNRNWTTGEIEDAKNVCGRMDELARLVKFTSRKEIIEIWHVPVAKLWDVLEEIVMKERVNHPLKWEGFERLAKDCVKRWKKH